LSFRPRRLFGDDVALLGLGQGHKVVECLSLEQEM
jgi:hypothetical protein